MSVLKKWWGHVSARRENQNKKSMAFDESLSQRDSSLNLKEKAYLNYYHLVMRK